MPDLQQMWQGNLALAKRIGQDVAALLIHRQLEVKKTQGALGPGSAVQKQMDRLGQNVAGGAPRAKATQDVMILLGQQRRALQKAIGGAAVTEAAMTEAQQIGQQIQKRIEQAIAEINTV